LPKGEIASPEPILPIATGGNLIDKDDSVLATMPRQISLTIAVDVEPPHHAPTRHGGLPGRGVDRFSLPVDVARQTSIDREQRAIASFYAGTIARPRFRRGVALQGVGVARLEEAARGLIGAPSQCVNYFLSKIFKNS
jgi:hypothetical protein